jgi:hypothetical protein
MAMGFMAMHRGLKTVDIPAQSSCGVHHETSIQSGSSITFRTKSTGHCVGADPCKCSPPSVLHNRVLIDLLGHISLSQP